MQRMSSGPHGYFLRSKGMTVYIGVPTINLKKYLVGTVESIVVEGKDAVSGTNIGNNPSSLMYCTKPIPRYSRAMNFSCFGLSVPTITRVGLFDEGFKIAYFEDNDYHHRMRGEGLDASCDLWAWFAHYGSRTVKEAGIPPLHNQFNANRKYFYEKWGFYPGSDEEREKAKSYNEK